MATLFLLLSVLLTLTHLAIATPHLLHLHRRGLPGAVYVCDETNFRGNCQWNEPSSRCLIVGPAGPGLQSLGPDTGGSCDLFETADCTGSAFMSVSFPGIANGMPAFESFKCRADVAEGGGGEGQNGTAKSAGVKGDLFADPRLAGGVGSLDRKVHLQEIQRMEANNFAEGLIGLKKGTYY